MKRSLILLAFLSTFAYGQEKPKSEGTNTDRALQKQLEINTKQGEKAIEAARQQVTVNPDSAEAHFNLAETLLKGPMTVDDYDKIRDEYLLAIKLKPDYVEAHLRLGNYYAWRDQYQKAYETYEKTISLKPDYAEAYCALGMVYIQKKFGGGRKLPHTEEESLKAIEAFKKAIQIKPDLSIAYTGLGEAYYYLERYNDSIEAYKQAVSMNANDIWSRLMIASVYIKTENKNGAMQEYEALKQIAAKAKEASKEQEEFSSTYKLVEQYAERLLKQIQEHFPDK